MNTIKLLKNKEKFPYFLSKREEEAAAFFSLGLFPIGEEKGSNGEVFLQWENNLETRRYLAVMFLLDRLLEKRKEAKK